MKMRPMNRFAKVDTRETDIAESLLGTVAIVGFPNVGKSTLVNRLTESRQAVVHETQGTTRDRKELVVEWNGEQFLVIDTGGVDIADPHPITRQIAEQARAAIGEADLVLFLVDARAGITPGDEELAQILRESKTDVPVLANKVDDVPGTTRDTIDTVLEHGDRTFVLVDTAGLRRKRKQRQGVDYYTELRALDAAERADVALVLIDASQGIVEGDITAVEVARKSHSATLIVLSKWDIAEITIEEVRPELQRRLRQRPDFITISSKPGRGASRLLRKTAALFDRYASRVQ